MNVILYINQEEILLEGHLLYYTSFEIIICFLRYSITIEPRVF